MTGRWFECEGLCLAVGSGTGADPHSRLVRRCHIQHGRRHHRLHTRGHCHRHCQHQLLAILAVNNILMSSRRLPVTTAAFTTTPPPPPPPPAAAAAAARPLLLGSAAAATVVSVKTTLTKPTPSPACSTKPQCPKPRTPQIYIQLTYL